MGFYVDRIIINNRAPFNSIDLSFRDGSISVLTAFNGKGKTTILSYIVDAWIEMTKVAYPNTYEGRENSYYRISSPLYDIDKTQTSIVYIRFKREGKNIDYVDIRNGVSKEWYESVIPMDDRMPYESFDAINKKRKSFKKIAPDIHNQDDITGIFDNALCAYFPSYRFELPNFLNEKYKEDVTHKIDSAYSGYLTNPLEVTSDIREITNWILDVVLDQEVNGGETITRPDGKIAIINAPEQTIWLNAKRILECALISKFPGRNVRFGIGRRNNSGSRLSIMEMSASKGDRQYCPSIFNLSSGELSILAIFTELLRRGDSVFGMIPMVQFTGIVLIDEVDKHLHIQLQKEVLPMLFNLFPKIQFIVSSHSPFLNMGLAEQSIERTVIYDLDNNGLESSPTNNAVYENAYKEFLNEKNTYAERYNHLLSEVQKDRKPLIITEGKTDAKHLKAATKRLGITDLDIDFFDIGNLQWGDSQLKNMLIQLSRIKQNRKIIGIFDRDSDEYISFATDGSCPYKNLGNNVFAFAIPLVNTAEYGDKISIEHYYPKKDLLSKDCNDRRLFLGEEFFASGNSKDGQYQTRISKLQNKISVNGIIDEKVFYAGDLEQKESIACSKDTFAEAILQCDEYTANFNFDCFREIFDVIRKIISSEEQ